MPGRKGYSPPEKHGSGYPLGMKLRQLLRDLPGYLLRGALITGPLVATIYVTYFLFRTVDDLLPIGIPGLGL